ncbi:unnamed protein product [Tuber melanosporum]|uniref:(Perigord truffle) hypothetical protein n=1 Tax=Tuber melanosporum (strain Mel28) TaxID=656061 RepID=D5G9T2_TUBMM|nr:uncharacterized protein GSTUM_00005060001 [Tuber melanosporum]CAZ81275.1 unnamed protein product [Tuber melanosporum]
MEHTVSPARAQVRPAKLSYSVFPSSILFFLFPFAWFGSSPPASGLSEFRSFRLLLSEMMLDDRRQLTYNHHIYNYSYWYNHGDYCPP